MLGSQLHLEASDCGLELVLFAFVAAWPLGHVPGPGAHSSSCREEHSMDRYRCRPELSERFGRHWSIRISAEIRMDQWPLCLVFREIRMDQWR